MTCREVLSAQLTRAAGLRLGAQRVPNVTCPLEKRFFRSISQTRRGFCDLVRLEDRSRNQGSSCTGHLQSRVV